MTDPSSIPEHSGERYPGDNDTPPWHEYDGCYGCRRGNAIAEKAMKRKGAVDV